MDFADARVSLVDGQSLLNINLLADGAKRIETFTTGHTGKTAAFVVDHTVVILPQFVTPIAGKSFVVGPIPVNEAKKIVDAINRKPRDREQRQN